MIQKIKEKIQKASTKEIKKTETAYKETKMKLTSNFSTVIMYIKI